MVKSSVYPWTDMEIRKKLCELIGLIQVPEPDEDAYERLQGCWAGMIDGDFDVVDAVRKVRDKDLIKLDSMI